MIALIGLGNPEKRYKETRHNVGWQCVDYLREQWQFASWDKKPKLKSVIAKGTVNGISVMLVKPQTYMNKSGQAVEAIASYFDIPPEKMWVIHDDLDLPLGSFKKQIDRGAASHNGVKSIINQLNTKAFYRWRVGIAPKVNERPKNSHAFVLKKFSFFEKRKLKTIFKEIKTSLEESIKKSNH